MSFRMTFISEDQNSAAITDKAGNTLELQFVPEDGSIIVTIDDGKYAVRIEQDDLKPLLEVYAEIERNRLST